MNQVQKLMARGQKKLEEAYPCVVVISSVEYVAASAGLSVSREVEVGGGIVDIDLTISLSKSVLPVAPIDGTRLTYRGMDYRIFRVYGDQSPVWVLECSSVNE